MTNKETERFGGLSRRSFVEATGLMAGAAVLATGQSAAQARPAAPVGTLARGGRPRARDLGVPFDGTPGPLNAITDIAGVSSDPISASCSVRLW